MNLIKNACDEATRSCFRIEKKGLGFRLSRLVVTLRICSLGLTSCFAYIQQEESLFELQSIFPNN